MNRRKALWLSLLSGGLLPAMLRAQDRSGRDFDRGFEEIPRRRPATPPRSADRFEDDRGLPAEDEGFRDLPEAAASPDLPPPNFHDEAGQVWRNYDIAHYTSIAYSPENPEPQNAIIEWIFRRTNSAIWHGEKIAVLSAGRAQLRAYHSPRWLRQVEDMVKRFTDATANVLSVRVRFFAAQDPRWRYAVHSRLNLIGSGPHGQQIWTLGPDDLKLVEMQLLSYPGFRALADQTVKLVNGQTLTVDTTKPVEYFANPQRDSAIGLGFQPSVQKLNEGIVLRFSPLLNYDGDMLDAAIELKATTVQRLYRTRILVRREIGPNEMALDVPEVTETRLNQTVPNWPLGQSLLISGGITPGILQSKTGFLNLRIPGTVPTDTELLVFLDVEPLRDPPRVSRGGRFEDDGGRE